MSPRNVLFSDFAFCDYYYERSKLRAPRYILCRILRMRRFKCIHYFSFKNSLYYLLDVGVKPHLWSGRRMVLVGPRPSTDYSILYPYFIHVFNLKSAATHVFCIEKKTQRTARESKRLRRRWTNMPKSCKKTMRRITPIRGPILNLQGCKWAI
jgi:hypothetical protein